MCRKLRARVALAFFAGFVGLLLFLGWAAAESRPGFLDPNTKFPPYVAPITLDRDQEPR
jgi:hypothetical protein